MTRVNFILILSFCCQAIFSQSLELKKYYQLINKAELALVEENYSASLKIYKEAFKAYRKGFASDYYNAALVAAQLKKYSQTYLYLKELAALGSDPKSNAYKDLVLLKGFWSSKYGPRAEILDSTTNKTYNKIYREIVLQLVENDQHFRHLKGSYTLYQDTINAIDKENVKTLLSLIDKYGFPSERLTGLNKEGLGLPATTIIIHQNKRKGRIFDFSEIVRKAILAGEFKNTQGSFFIEGNTGKLNGIYNPYSLMRASYDSVIIYKDEFGKTLKKDTTLFTEWGYGKINDSTLNKIKENRKELMLEPIELALKKDIFRLTKQPEYRLGSFDSGVTWQRVNFSEFLYMKEHLIYVN